MVHVPLLDQLALLFAVAVLVSIVAARLKLPSTAGLLVAGALAGPSGLGLASRVEEIHLLAEVGVVLLLFSIGMELSLERLRSIARLLVVGGALQVGLTLLAVAGGAVLLGTSGPTAIALGMAAALSSTAIVLATLKERGELDAPHGRFVVGVLVFQDLLVVPMVLLVPLLGGPVEEIALPIAAAMGKAAAMIVGVVVVSRFLVPRLMQWIEATRSREVFLLAVVALCMGTAWLTALAGLSLALGAFLGGLVIASTEFKHRAMGELLPLRELFTALFFVSLGMLFDVRVLLTDPLTVLGLVLAFTVLKGAIATAAALAMRFPARASWLAGVGLAQFGEFGFVLLSLASREGLIDERLEGAVIAAGVASMFLTPLLIRLAPHLHAGEQLLRPLERLLGAGPMGDGDAQGPARDHIVVAGLGVAGRLLLEGLEELGVGFVALDLVAERVTELRARHPHVYYADVTSEEALHHAHVEHARAVVIAINDPEAVRRALAAVRRANPSVPIWVRTRYAADQPDLVALGATEVVCEEIESASRLLALVLSASGAEDAAVARYQERARDVVRRSLVPAAPST